MPNTCEICGAEIENLRYNAIICRSEACHRAHISAYKKKRYHEKLAGKELIPGSKRFRVTPPSFSGTCEICGGEALSYRPNPIVCSNVDCKNKRQRRIAMEKMHNLTDEERRVFNRRKYQSKRFKDEYNSNSAILPSKCPCCKEIKPYRFEYGICGDRVPDMFCEKCKKSNSDSGVDFSTKPSLPTFKEYSRI